MQYMMNLTPHFEALAHAISFEIQQFGLIELEAVMLDLASGAPEGMYCFEENGLHVHPMLMIAAMPAFSRTVAELLYVDFDASEPMIWSDLGYANVGAAFNALTSDAARATMSWSTEVLSTAGYCPVEVMFQAIATGEGFEQVKIRHQFGREGLQSVPAA
ncbi:hypothetical protein ACRCPS_17795 [Pseudomonas aeruginosa]